MFKPLPIQVFNHYDVLLELDNDFVKEQIKNADIITITAGGNDLIQAASKLPDRPKRKRF